MLSPQTAAAQADHEGRAFHSCSQHCADVFAPDPAKFAPAASTTGIRRRAGREPR